MRSPRPTKSGFIAIVGRPNVGKSTLLNALVGAKLAIVTPKPQTTRNRILGILTRGNLQAVFLDTPGIHRARGGINRRMVHTALATISQADIIMHIVEVGTPLDDIEELIAKEIGKIKTPCFLVINKIDLIRDKRRILPEIERIRKIGNFAEVVPISALKEDGLDVLIELTGKYLPKGPHYYPPDAYTDLPERFIAAEMIREQVLLNTHQEIPYATAVTIEEFKEGADITRIRARVHVETESQKGILIGAGGSMMKKIGSGARNNIEKMVGQKVFLEIYVDVIPNWRRDEAALDKLGYNQE